MLSKRTYQIVATFLVADLFTVSVSELLHAAQPDLIPSVSLVPGVNGTATPGGASISNMGATVHENAIIEARYFEPPNTAPLPLNGVTFPVAHSLPYRTIPQIILWRVGADGNPTPN
jgi:hypothetical protein